MRLTTLLFSIVLGLASAQAFSAGAEGQIRAKITAINPQIQILSVKPAVIEGLFEVELSSGEVLYSSESGDHFVLGKLFEVRGNSFVNLTEQRKKGMRAEALKALHSEDMVVFSPAGEVKATVYAFTDVECGYCQKLHGEMADYNARGIEIRYLAYPRAGVGSRAYNTMVSVWCADDRRQAMTTAKRGGKVEAKSCDNPVADQYALGNQFGVTGTPALVFEDGSLMPGYVPADRLASVLELN